MVLFPISVEYQFLMFFSWLFSFIQGRICRKAGKSKKSFSRKEAEATFKSLVKTHEKYGWVTPPVSDGWYNLQPTHQTLNNTTQPQKWSTFWHFLDAVYHIHPFLLQLLLSIMNVMETSKLFMSRSVYKGKEGKCCRRLYFETGEWSMDHLTSL